MVLYIITGIAFLVIPIIFLFIKFREKKNFTFFLRCFSTTILYILPHLIVIQVANGGIDDKEFLIALAWTIFVIILILGLVSGIMYYFFIKKFLKEDQNALSFLFSLGINSGYAFYFYIFSGIILKAFQIVIIDEEN